MKQGLGLSPFEPLSRVFLWQQSLHATCQYEKFMLKCKFTEWEASDGTDSGGFLSQLYKKLGMIKWLEHP